LRGKAASVVTPTRALRKRFAILRHIPAKIPKITAPLSPAPHEGNMNGWVGLSFAR
jgi:hypothetical protein